MTDDFHLTDRAKLWIQGIKGRYAAQPLPSAQAMEAAPEMVVGQFKIL